MVFFVKLALILAPFVHSELPSTAPKEIKAKKSITLSGVFLRAYKLKKFSLIDSVVAQNFDPNQPFLRERFIEASKFLKQSIRKQGPSAWLLNFEETLLRYCLELKTPPDRMNCLYDFYSLVRDYSSPGRIFDLWTDKKLFRLSKNEANLKILIGAAFKTQGVRSKIIPLCKKLKSQMNTPLDLGAMTQAFCHHIENKAFSAPKQAVVATDYLNVVASKPPPIINRQRNFGERFLSLLSLARNPINEGNLKSLNKKLKALEGLPMDLAEEYLFLIFKSRIQPAGKPQSLKRLSALEKILVFGENDALKLVGQSLALQEQKYQKLVGKNLFKDSILYRTAALRPYENQQQ